MSATRSIASVADSAACAGADQGALQFRLGREHGLRGAVGQLRDRVQRGRRAAPAPGGSLRSRPPASCATRRRSAASSLAAPPSTLWALSSVFCTDTSVAAQLLDGVAHLLPPCRAAAGRRPGRSARRSGRPPPGSRARRAPPSSVVGVSGRKSSSIAFWPVTMLCEASRARRPRCTSVGRSSGPRAVGVGEAQRAGLQPQRDRDRGLERHRVHQDADARRPGRP